MADNEVLAGTTTDKHDDFFDEPPKGTMILTPEPPKENGNVGPDTPTQNGDVESETPLQNGVASPVPQETTESAPDEGDKGDGDVTADVNGVQESQEKEDGENEGTQSGVQIEAEVESKEDTPAEDAGVEEKPNGEVEQQMNGEAQEQDALTSHPATPADEPSAETDGNAADDETHQEDKPASTTEQEPESEPSTEPKTEGESQAPADDEQEKEDQPRQSPTGQEERRPPSGGEDNYYEDSFSDDTSLKDGTKEDQAQAPIPDEGERETEGDAGVGAGETESEPQRLMASPSPSDSRAEAGAVVPVMPAVEDTKATDGRSSATVDDEGELYRGEDRKEEPAPEESENCRGQGQWKTEEQQYIASAVLAQKSEKEALDEALKGKEKLYEEYSEAQVKDLQERLAILARENESKDKRISKLEQDLIDVTDKLRETERKLFASEKINQQHQDAPKSKTCTIM